VKKSVLAKAEAEFVLDFLGAEVAEVEVEAEGAAASESRVRS
jgi:hypothetical protein